MSTRFPGSFNETGWRLDAAIFGLLLGAITGVAIGVGQWVALLLSRAAGVRLLGWMGLGVGLTHALFDAAPGTFGIVPASAVAGLGIAAAYAWRIGDLDRGRVLLVGAGWAFGLIGGQWLVLQLGMPWEQTPVGWSTEHMVQGIVVGAVWGAATVAAGVPARLRNIRQASTGVPAEVALDATS